MIDTEEIFQREEILIGEKALIKLHDISVIIFGVGGVGGYVAESLARSGVGRISLVDGDTVSVSNINRQIAALTNNIGKYKTEIMKERISFINPACEVTAFNVFFDKESAELFDLSEYSYVIDAMDTVSAKLLLIELSKKKGVRIISSMGTGNKLDPLRLKISDISKTSVCPLAKTMRYELKKRNISGVSVLWSDEIPIKKCTPPGSLIFVPACAGMIIGLHVVKEVLSEV